MKKKEKKIRTKKLKIKIKNKNLINVKINIDNSKKSTTRRSLQPKEINNQPFINFPSQQPRIHILENKSNSFSSPDLTKTLDEYQNQFRTYMETNDKNIKNMIEKNASNVFSNSKENEVLQEPIKKSMSYQEPIIIHKGLNPYSYDKQKIEKNTSNVLQEPIKKNIVLQEPIKKNMVSQKPVIVYKGLNPNSYNKQQVEQNILNVLQEPIKKNMASEAPVIKYTGLNPYSYDKKQIEQNNLNVLKEPIKKIWRLNHQLLTIKV